MLIDSIGPSPESEYVEPSKISFEDRIRLLGRGDRRVAYVYESPDSSTFRYRVYNMVEALRGGGHGISASWFTRADLGRSLDFLDRADVLVICRTRYDEMVGRLVSRARARRLRILYDVDDLIFDPNYAHLIADTLDLRLTASADWDNWFAYIARLGATLRLCDDAITTTPTLAQCIADYAPWMKPRIVPNFLNRHQIAISQRLYDHKKSTEFRNDGSIRVGYFSGTPTHNKDFRIVAEALHHLFRKDSRIILRIVGFLELPADFTPYLDRVEIYPLQGFIDLQHLHAEVEINISPLQNNIFTNCKSELKYFETAIVGTITIASPTHIFSHVITDGKNGFLARTQDWEKKIEEVTELASNRSADYIAIAERAYAHADQTYSWKHQANAIATALFGNVEEHSGRTEAEPFARTSANSQLPAVDYQKIITGQSSRV